MLAPDHIFKLAKAHKSFANPWPHDIFLAMKGSKNFKGKKWACCPTLKQLLLAVKKKARKWCAEFQWQNNRLDSAWLERRHPAVSAPYDFFAFLNRWPCENVLHNLNLLDFTRRADVLVGAAANEMGWLKIERVTMKRKHEWNTLILSYT